MFGLSHFPLDWADAILISILISLILTRFFSLSGLLACLLGRQLCRAPLCSCQCDKDDQRVSGGGNRIERYLCDLKLGRFWTIQNLHLRAPIMCGYLSMIIDQAGLKKWNSWQTFDFLQFIVDIQTKLLLIIIQFLVSPLSFSYSTTTSLLLPLFSFRDHNKGFSMRPPR